MSQVVAPLLSKIIARFLLNAENSGWRLGLGMVIDNVQMLFTVPQQKVSDLRKTVWQTTDKSFVGQPPKR